MTRTYRRPGGLAVLAAAAAIGLAACSGGGSSTPHVANLGSSGNDPGSTNGSGSSTTAPSGSNPTQLLDQWAACIRHHGDPSQVDPTIDSNKDIDINMTNVSATLAGEVHGSTGPCSNYLLAAENQLRGGQPAPSYNPVKYVEEAQCIRAHGIANYPDPGANGQSNFNGTGVDPKSPAVQNATKACDKKLGLPYYGDGTSPPGVVEVRSCTPPPGKKCPTGLLPDSAG
jgi:hypothetical protein